MNLLEAETAEDVRTIRRQHRSEDHDGDQSAFFDCAACGAIDHRLERFERKERLIQEATTIQ